MSDALADLKRRAYARPLSEGDAVEAQAELARLAARAEEPDWAPPRPPGFAVPGAGPRWVLGAAALLALVGAAALPSPAPASLAVFAREQAPLDLSAPPWAMSLHNGLPGYEVDESSIRWLAEDDGKRLFAYQTVGGSICLTLVLTTSAASTCATPEEFAKQGLTLAFGMTVDQQPVNTAVWAPDGETHIYDGAAPTGGTS
jgi:hypothetical protein